MIVVRMSEKAVGNHLLDSAPRRAAGRLAVLAGVYVAILAASLLASVASASAAEEFGFAPNGIAAAATNADGTPDTQAGSHPFALSTGITVKTIVEKNFIGEERPRAEGGNVRDIEVNLPPGLVGDPAATSLCSARQFSEGFSFSVGVICPEDTQVGIVRINLTGGVFEGPVYNITPPKGDPAEFGFKFLSSAVVLVPSVRTGSDYGVNVRFTGIPEAFSMISGTVILWGVPADPRHNTQRGACLEENLYRAAGTPEYECPTSEAPRPFLSMPTSCSGPLTFKASIDSWLDPGSFVSDSVTIPGMTGCEKLDFTPQVVVAPEPAQAASPSGLSVEIQVPQTYENPEGLAEANLKDTTVTLPAGVTVNPAAGDGLAGCSEEQFGLHDAAEVTCPDASKIGQVEITTPLLANELRGSVFLAQQGNLPGNGSNPFGSLLAIYLAVRDPQSGVLVKLAGEVKPDPATGQLVTTFLNNPQVPFDSLKLSFSGGPRGALLNPPVCGSYTTSTEMTPWSGGASASPSSVFAIDSGPQGAACSSLGAFKPQLVSGTESNQAGGFSPFSLTFDRADGEQDMSRIQVTTPPGLLGTLANVALCGEPQAAQGTCGADSLIGHVTVGVGAGSNPYYVTGKVYLTGSYNGAPYGLAFVVPAVAGPLNLGTVIVRAAVNVDPHTAALTVTSEPLPQVLQGVPLHIRAVNVTLDRERFIFNPTNCNATAIRATMTSSLGAVSPVSTHFQATNCAALSFHPKFSVTTSGKTSRVNGASLDARLIEANVGGQPILATNGGQANIARVKVELPKALPSRLTTLQKACTAQVFEANPANCPAASLVGYAKASTPLLPVQLTGPAYFVSHGGEAFPSLIVVLQGYGVRVDLIGATFISKKGITSSTFGAVPDVPVSSFELYLPEGPYSALAANGNLCQKKLVMPTEMVGQDGTTIHQSTPIGITGCTKTKTKKKATAGRKASKATKPGRGRTATVHADRRQHR
jgi:hypothetical protein